MLLAVQLLWTRSIRNLAGILLLLTCFGLGPLLGQLVGLAPILDANRDLATPWLALLATCATSLAVWGLQGLDFLRRVRPMAVLTDALAAASLIFALLVLATASAWSAGFPPDLIALPVEALRLGGLAALVVALLPDSPRLAPALVWLPAWALPAALPMAPLRALAPFGAQPLATLVTGLGLLLLAHACSPHALRSPR